MCGRYSITKSAKEIGEHFGVGANDGFDIPRYNAAPTLNLPAIGMNEPERLRMFRWGLRPAWKTPGGNDQLIINARIESVSQKKTFSNLLKRSRCLIPADGFYEWEKFGKTRQPWRFVMNDESLFAFAGIFEKQELPNGQSNYVFCILTTVANSLIMPLHGRMPVIIDSNRIANWLDSGEYINPEDYVIPYPSEKMRSYKVSPLINNVRLNSPELILPWTDPALKLF